MPVTVYFPTEDGGNVPVDLPDVDSLDLDNEETFARLQEMGKEFGATGVSLDPPQPASDAPQGSSAQPVIPEDEPEKSFGEKAGRFMGSLSTEVVVGTLGQIAGTAAGIVLLPVLGPWGPVVGYAAGSAIGGAAGSYLGQKIEGKDKVSPGRIGSAMIVNQLPSGVTLRAGLQLGKALLPSAIKAADKATAARLGTTTMKTVGGHSAADTALEKLGKIERDGLFSKNIWKESAARGATVGFTETQLKEWIDEGRPAGVVESVAGATVGAVASLAVTGAVNRLSKLMSNRSKSGDTTGYGLDEPQMIERASYENSKVYQENLQLMEAQLVDIQNQSFTLSNLKREITPDTEKVILMGESSAPSQSNDFENHYNNPDKIVEDETISSLANYDSKTKTTRLNSKAIKKDWDEGMPYLQGKGEGIHATTSKQKAEVMKDIDIDAFREKLGSWEGYRKFIAAHEYSHEVLGVADMPRKDGKIIHMDEKAIQLEKEANEHAAKTLGIDWGSLRKKLKPTGHEDAYVHEGTVQQGPNKGEKYSTDIPERHNWQLDVKKGEQFTADVYQGRGKTREEIYSENSTSKAPVAGEAEYYALNEQDASSFGEVTKHTVSLENPYVIKSGKDLDKFIEEIEDEAQGDENFQPDDWDGHWAAIVEKIKAAGHDGIYVEVNELNDLKGRKMIRRVFGVSQIVKFRTAEQQQAFTSEYLDKPKSDTLNVYWGGENANKPANAPERILSNLAKRQFTWEGKEYGSVEHAYQSNKSGTFDLSTYNKYNKIGGHGSKIRGKGTVAEMKAADSLGLMKRLVVESFKQNPNSEAAKTLMQYGNFTHNTNQLIDQAFLEGLKLSQQELKPKPTAPSTKDPFDMSDAVTAENIAGVTEPPEFVPARDRAGVDSGEPTVFGGKAPPGVSDMVDPKPTKNHPSANKEKKPTPGATEEDRVAANNATRKNIVSVFREDVGDLANGLVIYKGPKDNWERLSMGFWSVNKFFKRQVAPSAALGPEMARMIERLKLESDAIEATSRKVFGVINKYRDSLDNKFKKGKHTPEEFNDAMTGFINGKGTLSGMDNVLKPIGKELKVARKLMRKQQIALIRLSELFELDPEIIKALRNSISFNNYHTDIFDIFLDPNWRSDPIKLGFALTERTISVYNQQVRIEIQAMEGGIPPADVEDRLKNIGGRFLDTDYKGETLSKIKTRQAAVVDKLRELAELADQMPSSTELRDAIKTQANELEEIKNKVKREGLTDEELDIIWTRSEEWANDSLSELEADSIHFQELKPNEQKKSTMTRALKKKRGVPYFQSQWMGKRTDPVKIFYESIQTSANLASAFRMDADMMIMFMREAQRGDSTFGKIVIGRKGKEAGLERLETRTGFSDTEIHVEKWVNDLQRRLLGNDNIFKTDGKTSKAVVEIFSVGMGSWKLGKTVGNIAAYPTNLVGSWFQMGVLGVMPNLKNLKTYGKGASRGLREFNWIDKWTRSMQKENPVEYEASMKEFEKLKRLGILSTDLMSADVMIQDSRLAISNVLNGVVEPFSKAYQIFDNAARYMVWQNYRNEIMDEWSMIPGGIDEIDRISAEMTLATYQYYNRLNPDIRKLGKIGLLNPFVAFSADMARTMGNTTEMNIWKVLGDEKRLRKMFNIKGGKFDAKKAKKNGYWGLFRMLGVVLGGAAYVSVRNKQEGFDQDQADAFSRSFTYSYDNGKPVVISIDKDDPDKFIYKNPEYANPYVAFSPFVTDLFNDLSPKGLADYASSIPSKLSNIYGGEGPPVINALWDVINNEVEGNPDPQTDNVFLNLFSNFEHTIGSDFVPLILRDTANYVLAHPKPSSVYSDKVISLAQSFSPNGTRLSRAQIRKRLVGIRENPGSFSETFSTKVRSSYGEYQDVMRDIHEDYEDWAGDQDESDMHWAMRRNDYLDDKLASKEGSFDVIRGKMNTFLEDAKTMDHYKDEQLFEILKKSGASSDYQSLVMDAWNSNKSFNVPNSRYLDFVEKLTVGEMSELTDMDEIRASIKQPTSNSPTYEAIQNVGETVSRARGFANVKIEQASFSTADRILTKGTTKDRINRLIEKGIKVGSPEFERLLKAGVVNGKIAIGLKLAEEEGVYEKVGRIR